MKRRVFLPIALVMLLIFSLTVGLVACVTIPENVEYDDKSEFISNGNFALTTTTTDYPRTPSGWSGEAGSTTSDDTVDTDAKTLVSGVINTRDDFYKAYSNNWGKLANPGKIGQDDDQILMIYNKKPTAYTYRSNSFSLNRGKYYKMNVSVRTDKIDGSGAYINVTGDGGFHKEFAVGNTNGQWLTYTAYFETSLSSSTSAAVGLSLGKGGKNSGTLSKGYAFFDNIIVEEITAEQYNAAENNDTTAKLSAKYGDSEFTNISGSSNVYTATAFTNAYSSNSDGSAPTGSDYLEKGIVDINNNPPSSLPGNYTDELGDTDGKFLFINNKQATAFGFRSNSKLRFVKGGYYRIDIKLATFIDAESSSETGATLRLMTGTSKDDTVAMIENIRTNNKWTTATFYIKADSMRDKDLYIEFDFGSGGSSDTKTLVKGQLLVDYYKVTDINQDTFDSKLNGGATALEKAYSLNTWEFKDSENILKDANTIPNTTMWAEDSIAYKDFSPAISGSAYKGSIAGQNTATWDTAVYGENPGAYNGESADVIIMNNAQPAVNYRAIYKNSSDITSAENGYFKITPNHYYRIGMWVKTRDIKKGAGLSVSLMAYDNSAKDPNTLESSRHTALQTISNFNTANLDEDNVYTELVFYVEGDLLKDKCVYLAFKLGSGIFLEPSTHVKGTAFISGITMFDVNYSDYGSESGDYVKQHSFKTSSGTVTNGSFDSINFQTTHNYYKGDNDNFKLEYSKDNNVEQGHLANAFGVPTSWTPSDEATLKTKLNAGVFNLNSQGLIDMLNAGRSSQITFNDAFYKGFESVYTATDTNQYGLNKNSNPNVLVISTKQANTSGAENAFSGRVAPFSFKSSSISLSANTYYMISVWAKSLDGTGSIKLSTTNKESDQIIKFDSTSTDWKRYDFYIETGFDSTTATLELFLGEAGTDNEISGTVFFDMPELTTISEKIYESASESSEVKVLTYTVNSMDNATQNEDALDTPNGWSGAQEDSEKSPRDTRDYVAGVYNYEHGSREWFGKDGQNIISQDDLSKILSKENPNALVINNNVATEYAYTYSLSKSLSTDSYYKISIRVLTYGLEDKAYATISLKLNNLSYTFSFDEAKSIKVNHNLTWTEYSFYINTPKQTSISTTQLKVALGTKDNLVKGYAFFDDLTIAKIDETQFNDAVPVDENDKPAEGYDQSKELRIVFTEDDIDKEPVEDTDETDPLLWLYISSGILGGLVVLAMLVYLMKWLYIKYIKPAMDERKRQNKRKNRTGDRNGNVYSPKDKDKYND